MPCRSPSRWSCLRLLIGRVPLTNNWSTADSLPSFNWATDATGSTTTGAKPGVTTAVTFSTTSAANQNNTILGGNFEINSLSP